MVITKGKTFNNKVTFVQDKGKKQDCVMLVLRSGVVVVSLGFEADVHVICNYIITY